MGVSTPEKYIEKSEFLEQRASEYLGYTYSPGSGRPNNTMDSLKMLYYKNIFSFLFWVDVDHSPDKLANFENNHS